VEDRQVANPLTALRLGGAGCGGEWGFGKVAGPVGSSGGCAEEAEQQQQQAGAEIGRP
jgi:hypothetical protein